MCYIREFAEELLNTELNGFYYATGESILCMAVTHQSVHWKAIVLLR